MKVKYIKNSKGFSLVELLVVLALIGLTVFIIVNILFFATRTQEISAKEYAMQSDIRRTTEITNELVRYSKAVFAVPQSFVESTDVMDPGWSYLMLSPDAKRIVIMEYDETLGVHVENTKVESSSGVLYYVEFSKDEDAYGGGVLKYEIYAYKADEFGNKINEILVFESTVEAINAIQVADKGTESSPSVALAFRTDGQTSGKGKNQIAYITIIVDSSGSMRWTPDGGTAYNTEDSRIYKVREALIGDGSSSGTGIIQQFSKEDNVFISYVPFSTTANYPSVLANTHTTAVHPIYEVYQSDQSTTLRGTIDATVANGGTNTGDALRRAYYLHETFRTRNNVDPKSQVHHYLIMLVDGETTYETNYVDWEDEGYYYYAGRTERIGGRNYYRFDWETDWNPTIKDILLPDGNIDLDYISSDEPNDEAKIFDSNYYGTITYKSGNRFYNYTGYIVKYGNENDDVTNIRITGNGSSVIYDNDYIDRVGNEIKTFDDGIRSYIIGYARDLGTHIEGIGDSIGTDSENIYRYDDVDFDIDEIFKNIATDIMADFWLAAGPQIMN